MKRRLEPPSRRLSPHDLVGVKIKVYNPLKSQEQRGVIRKFKHHGSSDWGKHLVAFEKGRPEWLDLRRELIQLKFCRRDKKRAKLYSSLDEPTIREPFSAKDLFCQDFAQKKDITSAKALHELWRQLPHSRRRQFEAQAREDERYCTHLLALTGNNGGRYRPHFGEFTLRREKKEKRKTRPFAARLLAAWANQIHRRQTLNCLLNREPQDMCCTCSCKCLCTCICQSNGLGHYKSFDALYGQKFFFRKIHEAGTGRRHYSQEATMVVEALGRTYENEIAAAENKKEGDFSNIRQFLEVLSASRDANAGMTAHVEAVRRLGRNPVRAPNGEELQRLSWTPTPPPLTPPTAPPPTAPRVSAAKQALVEKKKEKTYLGEFKHKFVGLTRQDMSFKTVLHVALQFVNKHLTQLNPDDTRGRFSLVTCPEGSVLKTHAMKCYQEAFDANVAKKQLEIMRDPGTTTIALCACVGDEVVSTSAESVVKFVAAATFSVFGFSRINHDKHHACHAPPNMDPIVELIAVGVRKLFQARGLGAIIVNCVRCLVTHMLGTSTRLLINHHMSTVQFWQHKVCAMVPSKRVLDKQLKLDSQKRWAALLAWGAGSDSGGAARRFWWPLGHSFNHVYWSAPESSYTQAVEASLNMLQYALQYALVRAQNKTEHQSVDSEPVGRCGTQLPRTMSPLDDVGVSVVAQLQAQESDQKQHQCGECFVCGHPWAQFESDCVLQWDSDGKGVEAAHTNTLSEAVTVCREPCAMWHSEHAKSIFVRKQSDDVLAQDASRVGQISDEKLVSPTADVALVPALASNAPKERIHMQNVDKLREEVQYLANARYIETACECECEGSPAVAPTVMVIAEDFFLPKDVLSEVTRQTLNVALTAACAAAAHAYNSYQRVAKAPQKAAAIRQQLAEEGEHDRPLRLESLRTKAVTEREALAKKAGGFEGLWRRTYQLRDDQLGEALVGKIVRIFWVGEGKQFEALVMEQLKANTPPATHEVLYLADGLCQREDLRRQQSQAKAEGGMQDKEWELLVPLEGNNKRNLAAVTSSSEQQPSSKELKSERDHNLTGWVACELCSKWRTLPPGMSSWLLNRPFVCSENVWSKYNNCNIAEEPSGEVQEDFSSTVEIHALLVEDESPAATWL